MRLQTIPVEMLYLTYSLHKTQYGVYALGFKKQKATRIRSPYGFSRFHNFYKCSRLNKLLSCKTMNIPVVDALTPKNLRYDK
jgi:hypothetical protein